MSLVSLVKTTDYPNVEQALKKSLDLIDFTFPNTIKKIVIKPNMCYYWDYSTGQTTNPAFVGSLIEIIRDVLPSAEISLVEADASAMKCKHAFKVLGYENLSQNYNVNLINLSTDSTETVTSTINGSQFDFQLPNVIKSADLRINIPKPKYMDETIITCALKNIFGCNPEPSKYKLHKTLSEAIVALNQVMKFDLHILDGIIVGGASTRKLNLIMTSKDPVAFDATTARIMGEDPLRIKHLKLAQKYGLGKMDFQTKGASVSDFAKSYPKRKRSTKFLLKGYKAAIKIGLIKKDLL